VWNEEIKAVRKELALEAGLLFDEYASPEAFWNACKDSGISYDDARKEAQRRRNMAAGKEVSDVEVRNQKWRVKAEEQEAAGEPMYENPSSHMQRFIYNHRMQLRGMPAKAKAVKVIKAVSVPTPPVTPQPVTTPPVKRAPAAAPEPVTTPPVKRTPATAPATAPAPAAAPVPEDSKARDEFLAEGYDEIVVGGKTYYRILETGDCFMPGELPYSIGEHMGIWDADLDEIVN
jgi:hypothetical protein